MTARRCLQALAAALAGAALLGACASRPPPPRWQLDAHGALGNYQSAYLRGEARIAEQEFARARSELASTGSVELVARAELTRCALQVASLEFDDCPGFQPLAQDAGAAARAYAAYLIGRREGIDASLLPGPFFGSGASRRPTSLPPSTQPRQTDGAGRFLPGSACRKSAPRLRATSKPRRPSGGASNWCWARRASGLGGALPPRLLRAPAPSLPRRRRAGSRPASAGSLLRCSSRRARTARSARRGACRR